MKTMSSISTVVLCIFVIRISDAVLPIVINTWPFTNATAAAWEALQNGTRAEDSLVIGCTTCEKLQCDGTVGFGGSPDETGETTLDAMIMDGETFAVGSVGDLRRVKNAIGVAQAVMHYTDHTLLVGEAATQFAIEMGFKEETLATNRSKEMYSSWVQNNCQPNFRQNVSPDPKHSCGPYSPVPPSSSASLRFRQARDIRKPHEEIDRHNHDTIGMVVIDKKGHVWAGTSTNGANHKVPGRVGDSPIIGSGSYASNAGGGAAATGDGDIMMRFLPSFVAVQQMELGLSAEKAAQYALTPIKQHYPQFSGAVVAVNKSGHHGAACHGFSHFEYSVASAESSGVAVVSVPCSPANI